MSIPCVKLNHLGIDQYFQMANLYGPTFSKPKESQENMSSKRGRTQNLADRVVTSRASSWPKLTISMVLLNVHEAANLKKIVQPGTVRSMSWKYSKPPILTTSSVTTTTSGSRVISSLYTIDSLQLQPSGEPVVARLYFI